MASLSHHTCHRCILRANNNRLPNAYSNPQCPPSPPRPLPCPACLGILQEPALQSAVHAVSKLLPTITHDSQFKINAAFPPSASLIRHRALRLSQTPHTEPVTLREAVKWSLCDRLELLGLTYSQDAELFVNLVYTHPETLTDSSPLLDAFNPTLNPRKRPRSTNSSTSANSISNITRILNSLSDLDFRRALPVPPQPIKTLVQVTATLTTAPLLLAGNYLKTSRIVSQTPWFLDSRSSPRSTQNHSSTPLSTCPPSKRTQFSVEDIVTSGIRPILQPEKATFTAGGREDVDVRMLGTGRPFVIELLNPRIVPSLVTPQIVARMATISAHTSDAVTLQNLRVVPKTYFSQMRQYESEKQKHYRCVVWIAHPTTLGFLKRVLEVPGGFPLQQKTPLRVLHRRTQTVRERHIYDARVVRMVNSNSFVLDLVAQAGTYIKEFVHGDNGRTTPNVAQLLSCEADILQLDVTRISHHE